MFKISREKESLKCLGCSREYNIDTNSSLKPKCLIPCGHTLCTICINKLHLKCCLCHSIFNQIIPDYQLCDIINKKKKEANQIVVINQTQEDQPIVQVIN
jgi:hypothetical protein